MPRKARNKPEHAGSRKKANEEDADLTAAFGPGKVDQDSAHAGALCLTDARILAFPVRSLKGVFAWVTCPAVLGRLDRDLSLAADRLAVGPTLRERMQALESTQALCVPGSPLALMPEKKIVLEEFEFSLAGDVPADLVEWLAVHAIAASDPFTGPRLRQQLVVLHDDYFTHFVRHATEVTARIGLDYETKTAKSGAASTRSSSPRRPSSIRSCLPTRAAATAT